VKNTDTAKAKGYDADKKVSGIKRHLAVDSQGLIHAVALTTANVTDRAGAIQAMTEYQENLSWVQSVLVDGSYAGQPFAQAVKTQLGATVQVDKRNQLSTFAVTPKGWTSRANFRLVRKMSKALEKP
jgi:transposase